MYDLVVWFLMVVRYLAVVVWFMFDSLVSHGSLVSYDSGSLVSYGSCSFASYCSGSLAWRSS